MRRVSQLVGMALCITALTVFAMGCNGGAGKTSDSGKGSEAGTKAPASNEGESSKNTEAAQTPGAAGEQVYVIDPDNSSIMWNATVPIGTREGGWSTFEGTIALDGDNIETAKINVTVDMTSAYSDAQELTKKLQGEDNFFNPVKYPKATFKSTSVKKTADGYEVTGDFTIRDVTRSETFPAQIELNGDTLTAKAKFDMNRQDYGITYQSTIGDYIIKDKCPLILDIVAKKKDASAPAAQ